MSSGDASPPASQRAVFRAPGVLLLVAFFITVCATPFALGAPGLQAIYLVPVALVVWTLRSRTTVDRDGIVARTVLSRQAVPWSELSGLRLTRRSGVRAMRGDGSEIALPTVRTRHLPVIAALSDGRIPDPAAAAAATAATATEEGSDAEDAPSTEVTVAGETAPATEEGTDAGSSLAAQE
ncbi:MAG: PH domain-containing protein [Pseudonocardiaceae bacterium]|nr:PH domain-containing protein [Pseudonocardiaceae bacterium]